MARRFRGTVGYVFDTIGNRTSSQSGGRLPRVRLRCERTESVCDRTVPAEILVTGEAATGATVSVRLNTNNASLANRQWGVLLESG